MFFEKLLKATGVCAAMSYRKNWGDLGIKNSQKAPHFVSRLFYLIGDSELATRDKFAFGRSPRPAGGPWMSLDAIGVANITAARFCYTWGSRRTSWAGEQHGIER